jgi:hypothetical protein
MYRDQVPWRDVLGRKIEDLERTERAQWKNRLL